MILPVAAPPAPGEAAVLAPGLMWARMPVPFRPGHVNLYAIAGDEGWTLIDTGFDRPETRAAWDALRTGPLAGAPLARLIVTHHHADHMGLAPRIMAAEGCALLTSRAAWLSARMLVLDRQEAPTPQALAFWRRAGMPAAEAAARAADRPYNMADAAGLLPPGYTRLVEGAAVQLGTRRMTVRLGEGHAPEHVTLWSDDLVIGGDQLLATISPNLGVYPSQPEEDTVGAWLESCTRLAAHATEAQWVLPGHGRPWRGLPARLAALQAEHRGALARLRDAMAQRPLTAVEGFAALYRRAIAPGEYLLALAEAVGHVNHLARTGAIVPAGHTCEGGQRWAAVAP